MSRYHIPEADRRMLNLSEAQIRDIERTCSQYPVSEHHPVDLVVVTCGNRRNGRVCGNAIATFTRNPDSKRFYLDVQGDSVNKSGSKASRRIALHYWSLLSHGLGSSTLLPVNGRRHVFQCAACGKAFSLLDADGLAGKVRKFADRLEKMLVSQWADGEDLRFGDYAPGDRSRGAYPLVSTRILQRL